MALMGFIEHTKKGNYEANAYSTTADSNLNRSQRPHASTQVQGNAPLPKHAPDYRCVQWLGGGSYNADVRWRQRCA